MGEELPSDSALVAYQDHPRESGPKPTHRDSDFIVLRWDVTRQC